MSDENERSVASAGSVAGKPVAWAALREDGDIAWIGYTPEGAADGACGRQVVPLYRSPALTDEEVEAVEWCIFQQATPQKTAVTLRRMLHRLK